MKITVFASGSIKASAIYINAARELGKLLADNEYHTFYGGGSHGLMKSLADGIIENNGKMTGVIPESLKEKADKRLSPADSHHQLIITTDIERRKEVLLQGAQCCIALPGGVGTWEELYAAYEAGLKVILLSTDDYYESLKAQHRHIYFEHAKTPLEAVNLIGKINAANRLLSPSTHQQHINNICNSINSLLDYVAVADESNTFVAIMEKSLHETECVNNKWQNIESPLSNAERLFTLSKMIVLFNYDVPLTYALLHKMITYNQLGFHGKNHEEQQIHKRVVLFRTEDFFQPTQQQLSRACKDNLLSESHLMGLTFLEDINTLIETVQGPYLTVEEQSLWKQSSNAQNLQPNLS